MRSVPRLAACNRVLGVSRPLLVHDAKEVPTSERVQGGGYGYAAGSAGDAGSIRGHSELRRLFESTMGERRGRSDEGRATG